MQKYWQSITGTTKSVALTFDINMFRTSMFLFSLKSPTPAGDLSWNENVGQWIAFAINDTIYLNMNPFQLSYSLSTNKNENEETKNRVENIWCSLTPNPIESISLCFVCDFHSISIFSKCHRNPFHFKIFLNIQQLTDNHNNVFHRNAKVARYYSNRPLI